MYKYEDYYCIYLHALALSNVIVKPNKARGEKVTSRCLFHGSQKPAKCTPMVCKRIDYLYTHESNLYKRIPSRNLDQPAHHD